MPQVTAQEPPTVLASMVAANLTPAQIAELMRLRREIASGQRCELTIEYKRLAFARFRYRLGLLHD